MTTHTTGAIRHTRMGKRVGRIPTPPAVRIGWSGGQAGTTRHRASNLGRLKQMAYDVEFTAESEADGFEKTRKFCNDGRCWVLTSVFQKVWGTAYATEKQVPRAPAGLGEFGD